MLLSFIMCFSGEGYLSVAYFQKDKRDFKTYVTNISIIPLIVCPVVCILSLLLHLLFPNFLGLNINNTILAIFISFFSLYVNLLLDYYRVKESIISYGCFSCSYVFLNFCLTIILIVFIGTNWYGRIYSMLICASLYTIFTILVFLKNSLLSLKCLSFKVINEVIKWGVPLIPHASSIWIRQGCDRYIINYYYSTYEVGIFSFALNLANIMNMIGLAFNSSNSVDIYKTLSSRNEGGIEKLQSYTKKMLLLFLVISIVISILLFVVVPILVPQYKSSLIYYLFLIPYGYLQCVYYLYCNYLYYFGYNRKLMTITFSISIVHLCLSFVFSRYSLVLTALVYVVTQTLIVLFLKHKVTSILKNNYDYKHNWIL